MPHSDRDLRVAPDRVEDRLRAFPEELQPLADLCRRYVADFVTESESSPAWCARGIRLLPAARGDWFEEHAKTRDVRIPQELVPVLSCVNGLSAFGLTLYGMIMTRFNQPLDIATANRYWAREYRGAVGFHFGGRHYSYTENAGYFLRGSKIASLLKSGDQVGEWPDFRTFLASELDASERYEASKSA